MNQVGCRTSLPLCACDGRKSTGLNFLISCLSLWQARAECCPLELDGPTYNGKHIPTQSTHDGNRIEEESVSCFERHSIKEAVFTLTKKIKGKKTKHFLHYIHHKRRQQLLGATKDNRKKESNSTRMQVWFHDQCSIVSANKHKREREREQKEARGRGQFELKQSWIATTHKKKKKKTTAAPIGQTSLAQHSCGPPRLSRSLSNNPSITHFAVSHLPL